MTSIHPQPNPFPYTAVERAQSPEVYRLFQALCARNSEIARQEYALADRAARREERKLGRIRAWLAAYRRKRHWAWYAACLSAARPVPEGSRTDEVLTVVALGTELVRFHECESWLPDCHPDDRADLCRLIELRRVAVRLLDTFIEGAPFSAEIAAFVADVRQRRGQPRPICGGCIELPAEDNPEWHSCERPARY
jgi:hypothetical protein